ncbi:SGNH/GDSL hydrolase family protein [Streptomyces cylindrosporus]|uniref:SGNH/GDSL hydrolase family protein n=1 Tax=Streptomyces cylindrosporus TaxID=2927583 RepID=A0ABS9YB48_9ACTN|nr:SGNH/GDSL hydrolase family protein [Streptomyces cylindrosporus]MCI3273866.1 SGNH/GDSL hydrolase family protein [Streptomyces cylindrosporus]
MRTPWIVGVLLTGVLLLGACGDPSSGPESAPPSPAVPGVSATTTHQRAPASASVPAVGPRVLYLGDSLAMEAQDVLGAQLRRDLNATYRSAPYSGTTLCDYLEGTGAKSLVPDSDKAAALVRSLHPDYVVLQFWGNAWGYTWCMDGITYDASQQRYFTRYKADLARLTEQIADAGGGRRPRIVWVLQGPDPITPDRVRRVNGMYERQAAAAGDLVADAGATVSPAGARYTWTQYLPCTTYEHEHPDYCTQPSRDRTALHLDQDYLHFCLAPTTSTPKPCPVRSPGILRIARAITGVIAQRVRAQ